MFYNSLSRIGKIKEGGVTALNGGVDNPKYNVDKPSGMGITVPYTPLLSPNVHAFRPWTGLRHQTVARAGFYPPLSPAGLWRFIDLTMPTSSTGVNLLPTYGTILAFADSFPHIPSPYYYYYSY